MPCLGMNVSLLPAKFCKNSTACRTLCQLRSIANCWILLTPCNTIIVDTGCVSCYCGTHHQQTPLSPPGRGVYLKKPRPVRGFFSTCLRGRRTSRSPGGAGHLCGGNPDDTRADLHPGLIWIYPGCTRCICRQIRSRLPRSKIRHSEPFTHRHPYTGVPADPAVATGRQSH